MKYCGVVPTQSALQLAMLEEVRTPEPPVRLEIALSRVDAQLGSDVRVEVPIRKTCTGCGGRGEAGIAALKALGNPPNWTCCHPD